MMTQDQVRTPQQAENKNTEVPLFSVESERLLLGAALDEVRKQFVTGLLPRHAPEEFHLEQHATLWRCINALHDNSLDFSPISVLDYTRRHNLFAGGTEYILGLADDVIARAASDEAINEASKRVKELAVARKLESILQQGMRLCKQAGQSPGNVLSLIEDDLMNLRKTSESSRAGPLHVREGVMGLLDRLQRQMDGEKIGTGVSTGSPQLDQLIGGLVDEDLIILGARPSMGKTAAMLNLARDGCTAGQPALVFSLEMKQVALTQRLLSREARINGMDLRTGVIRDEDWGRLSEGADTLGSADIWIDDTSGLTLQEIRSRARTFVASHGKCTIYVDYLQHVGRREGEDEKSHASNVSRGLKGLARELKCPVVALSQLNRSLESRANKRPIMSDLRESGSIEQDADVIMFLYRDEVYNPESKEPGIAEWIVAKQRDGAIGTIKRPFTAPTGHFGDFDSNHY